MGVQQWEITGPRTVDVGDAGEVVRRLDVDIVAGRVDVVGHDEDVAVLEVHEVVGEPVEVSWDGAVLRIRQEQRRGLLGVVRGNRTAARLTVAVPRRAETKVSSVSAEVLVADLRADVRADCVSGPTTLRAVDGDIKVDTVSGAVTATETRGTVDVDTVSGSVTLSRLHSTRVDLDSVSGSLVADLAAVDEPCLIDVDGVSASVHLRLPRVPVSVSCDSLSGKVTVDGVERPKAHRSFAEDGALVRVTLDGVSSSAVIVRTDEP